MVGQWPTAAAEKCHAPSHLQLLARGKSLTSIPEPYRQKQPKPHPEHRLRNALASQSLA